MATAAEKVISLEAENTALKQQLSDKTEALSQANDTAATRQTQLLVEKAEHAKTRQILADANSTAAARSTQLQQEQADHSKTKQALATATGEVAAAGDVIAELNIELSQAQEKAATGAGQARTVKHAGITYEVAVPRFRVGGTIYTAADLTEGSALVAELVAAGSGVLVAIDTPGK